MIEIKQYTEKDFCAWNDFVQQSRNSTFLHDRRYMDYHSDRFCDCSLMFYNDKGKLIALLPANVEEQTIYSHKGLTYGGLLIGSDCHYDEVCQIFGLAMAHFSKLGMRSLIYSPAPHVYHKYPCEEDLYWLYQHGAKLLRRSLSSTVDLSVPLPFSHLRQRKLKAALAMSLEISEDASYLDSFWQLLEENLLKRHGVRPVHTLDEIKFLSERFPDEISLHTVLSHGKVIAGCVLYKSDLVVHAQYIAADEEGRKYGALDYLFHEIICKIHFRNAKFFDFGISTEQGGSILNEGLLFQKEGLGGRGICYDTYEYKIS